MPSDVEILGRIKGALEAGAAALSGLADKRPPGAASRIPRAVLEADRVLDAVLRDALVRGQEGWLSEESEDDSVRLRRRFVWIVDPLDGTGQFIAGIPEWTISIAWVEDGRAIAAGISNPATGEVFLGSRKTGVTYNGGRSSVSRRDRLEGALILASRSELERGEWARFRGAGFSIQPLGSIAYKLARVAAGLADATWTLNPKNEWDVAAGSALVDAAGGCVRFLPDAPATFNRPATLLPGLFACGPGLTEQVKSFLAPHIRSLEPSNLELLGVGGK